MKDDPFPGSQEITEYGPFVSWSNTTKDIKLYSITEKNDNVCFATRNGVQVTDCEMVQSSSSSEPESSSSVEAPLSSSSQKLSSSSTIIASSESIVNSSSSFGRRSSSSVVLESSSSIEKQGIVAIKNPGFGIGLDGRVLNVNAPAGKTRLRLFDAQGHLLLERAVAAPHASVDLGAFAGDGLMVVQLVSDGKTVGAWRITVR